MSTLTTETPQLEEPRETQPVEKRKPRQPEREKTKQKQESKSKGSLKQLILVAIVVFAATALVAYDYQIVRERKLNDEWSQKISTLRRDNNELTEIINNLRTQILEQTERIDALEKENQELQKKLDNARAEINEPWINGTVLAVFSTPTNINQMISSVEISFPEGILFNTTVKQKETQNYTIFWTSQKITEFEGEIRYNVTRLPNSDATSLHVLFSAYQAPQEIKPYLKITNEFKCTDEELNGLLALIDPSDTVGDVIVKTLNYANDIKEYNLFPCTTASLKAIGLLRNIGIPSRMVGGFLAHYSFELIGGATGHAWIQVYLDGCWLDYNANGQWPAINNFVNTEIIDDKATYQQFVQSFSVKANCTEKIYSRMTSDAGNEFTIILKLKYPSEDTN